jgi:26S proteasome regulatory complex component
MIGAKYVQNAEQIRKELMPYLASRDPQRYILHYSRELITRNREQENIDNRPNQLQNQNNDTLQDMDDRNKEEKRSDELYIREILSKNGFLESEVQRLKDKIDELESDLEDAMSEADENKHATMADATTSTIGQVAQLIPTLLDKYFAIQEQKTRYWPSKYAARHHRAHNLQTKLLNKQ